MRVLAAAAALACTAAQGADFDGSRTLLCANLEALDCVAGEECLKGLPDQVGAPQFMRIDFARKAVVGPKRESAFRTMEQSEGQLLLQGTELDYGWTIALNRQTGKTVVTILNRDGAFVLFGACTPL
jgi:hypothetical protein